jgi:hypothetical protein
MKTVGQFSHSLCLCSLSHIHTQYTYTYTYTYTIHMHVYAYELLACYLSLSSFKFTIKVLDCFKGKLFLCPRYTWQWVLALGFKISRHHRDHYSENLTWRGIPQDWERQSFSKWSEVRHCPYPGHKLAAVSETCTSLSTSLAGYPLSILKLKIRSVKVVMGMHNNTFIWILKLKQTFSDSKSDLADWVWQSGLALPIQLYGYIFP